MGSLSRPQLAYPPPQLDRRESVADRRESMNRIMELTLTELRHQPLLKVRVFSCGFFVGLALTAGFFFGLCAPYLHG